MIELAQQVRISKETAWEGETDSARQYRKTSWTGKIFVWPWDNHRRGIHGNFESEGRAAVFGEKRRIKES